MGLSPLKIIRKWLWKVIGTDPGREATIDLISPRRQIVDYSLALMAFYTRLTRQRQRIGEKGSLLGDYLEFGCYKGDNLIYVFKRASSLMPWMRFYAFDSFCGLPELENSDKSGEFLPGQFSCSQDDFLTNLKKAKVDLNRVRCVPGWFKDTLTPEFKIKENLKIASIVYIDCDIYESCTEVLGFITDIVETGTIIIFDDWFAFKADSQKGTQLACREWLLSNPNISLQDWHAIGPFGKSFIVNIKNTQ